MNGLDKLIFDNRFINELPADSETENFRRQVMKACYSHVLPTQVTAPTLVAYSSEMAKGLDLSDNDCQSEQFSSTATRKSVPKLHHHDLSLIRPFKGLSHGFIEVIDELHNLAI